MSNLPVSWINVQLGDVVDYGNTSKAEPMEIAKDSWILELEDIEKTSSKLIQRILFSERQSKSTKNKFEKNDVLYGKLRPYLDKVIIANESGYCTTEIIPIKPGKYLDNRFLFYGLKRKEFIDYVSEVSHGLNMPRLGTRQGQAAPFVLAPLNEQIRIADKLDSVLAKVDAAQARLGKIPTLLKRFRQSVLAAATSGELTREWREDNAEESSWSVLPLGDIAEIFTGVTPLKKETSYYEGGTIPWLTSSVTGKSLVTKAENFVTEKAVKECRLKLFSPGTLLVAMYGEGKTRGQVTEIEIAATINQACAAVVVNQEIVERKYIKISIENNYEKTRMMAEGGNQPNLNLSKVRSISINLPSKSEQKEIVRRVESLFTLADTVEKQYLAAKQRLDRLTQSLLAKAFRGELVPQDPNDEPAAELLKRIQAERNAQPPVKNKRKQQA
jgi:type I restriction enzyme S subunit